MSPTATDEKPATEAVVRSNPAPRPIRMEGAALRPVPAPAPTKLYECGTIAGCPRQNVDVLGVTFAAFRGTPTIHTDGRVDGGQPGHRHRLTDDKVKRILEEIGHKVVRIYAHGQGDLYDDRSTQYTPAEGDQRLGNFLWMREITEDGLKAEAASPTTLSD